MEKIRKQFKLSRKIFESKDPGNDFKIYAAIDLDSPKGKLDVIKGLLPDFEENLEVDGFFTPTKSENYGDQYDLKCLIDYEFSQPEIEELAYDLLGKVSFQSLQEKEIINKDFLDKLINNEYDLINLKGMGESKVEKLKAKIQSDIDSIILVSLLKSQNVTEKMAHKILRNYGSIKKSVQIARETPYLLANVKGIGFKKADKVSVYSDQATDINKRVVYATHALLKKNEEAGSTYLTLRLLKEGLAELLDTKEFTLEHLYEDDSIVITENIIGYRKTLDKEQLIASKLLKKMGEDHPFPLSSERVENFLNHYQEKEDFQFAKTQKDFFSLFTQNNIVALLGYAGTGKSALQKATVKLSELAGWKVGQVAPTGRAAQVMQSYTGIESSTLHKRFKVNQVINGEPVEAGGIQAQEQVLLIDECSMIDIVAGEYLVSGIENVKRIVFVGDPEQLPSVGAGRFLQDLIDGGIPYVELKDVFRQSEGGILDLATKARKGKNLVPSNTTKAMKFGSDAIFHEVDKERSEMAITFYIKQLLKKVDLNDIIVITPKNVGVTGTESLNRMIQRQFNPKSLSKKEYSDENIRLRVGDTVLCNANSEVRSFSGKKVMINNGEIGKLIEIEKRTVEFKGRPTETLVLIIDFGGTLVTWRATDSSHLKLGYAITIHKMQGSSSHSIIMVADKSNTYMLNRQLVYTGLTRPRKKLILLGDAQTINMAVKKDGSAKRNTMLATYLKQLVHNKENTN